MREVGELPNIGKRIEEELKAAGMATDEELAAAGAVEALLRINGLLFDEGCLNKLYALEGAIQGLRWHFLDKERKEALKLEYRRKCGKA